MKIEIKGAIIPNESKVAYDYLGLDSTCPKDVLKKLSRANGQDVTIEINSGGGDIFAGSEIYTALRNYKGNVNINIVGLAASAASVIAMAGNCKISPTGLFMIHNVSCCVSGDYKVLEKEVEVLKKCNQVIANAYMEKTGISNEKLLELMDKETWLTPKDCIESGFVDEIMFQDEPKKIQFRNDFTMLSIETEEKIKNEIAMKNKISIEKEKLNLLKLGGVKNV
ncbi:MAG: Clp protease ClpP [Eubacteriales bacterium]|nr:Clp protease ClpP [Eubacteriales bacterium]